MKKLAALLTLVVSLVMMGCGEDIETPTPQPTPGGIKPELQMTVAEVTYDSVTLTLTANTPSEYGICIVREGFDAPHINEWFTQNSGDVDSTTEVTISGLEDNCNYVVYAILRAKADGMLGMPQTAKISTPDDGVVNPITVLNTTFDSITFEVNIATSYLLQVVDAGTLKQLGVASPEEYIKPAGIGIPCTGAQEYTWYDGGSMSGYNMHIYPGMMHYIIVAQCDSNKNITGEIFVRTVTTPTKAEAKGNITVELTDITPTSVKINTTPDSNIAKYWVYIETEKWYTTNVAEYGEATMITIVKAAAARGMGWELEAQHSQVWSGLLPNTAYCVGIAYTDSVGGEKLVTFPFTTTVSDLPAPKVEATVSVASENPHENLNINIYSADAASVRIAFAPTADIDEARAYSNNSEVVAQRGMDLTAEQVEAIKTSGLSLLMSDLLPDTEYTALVSVRNIDYTETVVEASKKTYTRPAAPRVESELFEALLGEWEVSYSLVQYNLQEVSISNKRVTIAAGMDDASTKEYRDQNRLVITNWPFQVSAHGEYQELPFMTPADLMESSKYWRDHPSLAYRDYGPKIFLEIGQDGQVSVPSSRQMPLYGWASDGLAMLFFGCQWVGANSDNPTAPCSFPVTVSADGNTITIGMCRAGEEFGFGNYRPAVFRDAAQLEPWAIATSDIILTRVK